MEAELKPPKPLITGTSHPLPFDQLSPADFERLCLWLVKREGFTDVKHLGASGNEQGRDITARKDGLDWAFQCKRKQTFSFSDAEEEIEKILTLPEDEQPDKYVFIASCNISAQTRDQVPEKYPQFEYEFWALTELDEMVKRHPDIVAEFFQLSAVQIIETPLQFLPRADPFIGRQNELDKLLADLKPGAVVEICATGGMGKTALAAEAIWRLTHAGARAPDDFPDGVFVHEFYGQPDINACFERLASRFARQPQPTPAQAAKELLAGKCMLLVLDGAELVENLDILVAMRARNAVLITSRKRGTSAPEWQDLDPLPGAQSLELLRQWGGDRAVDQAAGNRICELVGCLPMALVLAGSYLKTRQVAAVEYVRLLEASLLPTLHQGERRMHSVPLLVERSLEGVSDAARSALGVAGLLALAPFEGAWIAAGLGLGETGTIPLLGELARFSLLHRDEVLYRVSHRLVHDYAREQIPAPDGALERLCALFTRIVAQANAQGAAGLVSLSGMREHCLAVLDGLEQAGKWDVGEELAWALEDYLDLQGFPTSRVRLCEIAIAAARQAKARDDEERWLGNLGLAYSDLGQVERAIEYHEQALVIAREIGDRRGEGSRPGQPGECLQRPGAGGESHRVLRAGAGASPEQIGDRRGEGTGLGNLGNAYSDLGQVERAIEYYEQALSIAERDRRPARRRG